MTSGLVKLGLIVLAAALVGLLVSATAFEGEAPYEPWIEPGLLLGAALVAVGLVLGALGRMGRAALPSRCARCGRTVERGQVYCADHLKLTVEEARDTLRQRNLDRGAHG